ncbi:DUF4136 domain-containing protein [Undibacterium sp. TJN25]|uniref:DUF4136 domain-containing protein n=1 Tax=Undibacterium sp. TJN25 TaxID=3413056 RepID=UPI003BF08A97
MKNCLRYCIISALAALTVVLAGCSTVNSQVTVFHNWPAEVKEKTYVFERQPAQQNNLEYNSYENLVRARLNQSGFTESVNGSPAFKVSLNYHTEAGDVQISLPAYYSRWNDPFWRFGYSRGPFYNPYFSPYYGFYGPFGPPLLASDLEVRRWYLHELDLLISEAGSGKQLFDIRSTTESLNRTLNSQMPKLVESAFKEFPGVSGAASNAGTAAK